MIVDIWKKLNIFNLLYFLKISLSLYLCIYLSLILCILFLIKSFWLLFDFKVVDDDGGVEWGQKDKDYLVLNRYIYIAFLFVLLLFIANTN